MDASQILLGLSLFLLCLGALSFLSGLIVILSKVMGNSVAQIAEQTKRIVQKGIAEEVAGLIGNASVLLDSINDLIKTATGVGAFLILIGIALMGAGAYLLIQLK